MIAKGIHQNWKFNKIVYTLGLGATGSVLQYFNRVTDYWYINMHCALRIAHPWAHYSTKSTFSVTYLNPFLLNIER